MDSYLVPAGAAEIEMVEKRSRFIGRVWPVESESEALAHIEAMRKKHYDATHNVYAYIIRSGGIMRYSDDGEPSGTSGQPTLNVFRQEEIFDVCCVVTRYFGGILLGTGGLVRAYSGAAKMALDAAGVACMAQWKRAAVPCAYSQYERVRRLLDDYGAVVEDTSYAADVCFLALVRADKAEGFDKALIDLTAGTARCLWKGEELRGVRLR